jgi:hypothetical protein
MKSLVNKLLLGLAGLAIASVPLAASAQTYHNDDRGSYQRNDNRGHADNRGNVQSGDNRYRVSYSRPVRQSYVDGYFGYAPGGFQGYYSNGGWYHHRRWNGGVWLYF